ncbi:MAG: YitT family protein, partial [Spirochaetales bacterium]|nr:YitT family protein [Spirochaetales bacterium]
MIGQISRDLRKRILLSVIGLGITGFSVGFFHYSRFGMDPFQVFSHGIWTFFPLSFGTFYAIMNTLMLIIVWLADRRKIGMGTVISIFLLGFVIQFSSSLLAMMIPDPDFFQRLGLLITGIVLMCFGSSLYYNANLGVSNYDAVSIVISEKSKLPFGLCRLTSDLICTFIGFQCGVIIGI